MLSMTFNLTHFRSFFISATPLKIRYLFTFSGGIDKEHWPEMG